MTLEIFIEYMTQWGECLMFCCKGKHYPLSYCGNGCWTTSFSKFDPEALSEYSYELYKDGICIRKEWTAHHISGLGPSVRRLRILDRWNDIASDQPFHSSLFSSSVFGRKGLRRKMQEFLPGMTMISVSAAQVRADETLAVVGSSDSLGCWKTPVPMNDSAFPIWSIALPLTVGDEYKFVITDKSGKVVKYWEKGENRRFSEQVPQEVSLVFAEHSPVFEDRKWRGAGTAVPVFSLRSEESFGIGEFNDLKLLVDWASATGQRIIQILPINDTSMTGTWVDSYPYNANSTIALHPQFVNLTLAGLEPDEEYFKLKDELNALPAVDYERVNAAKISMLRKLYKANGRKVAATAAYRKFVSANEYWLLPYSVFCCLRDETRTVDFRSWKGYSRFSMNKMKAFREDNPEAVGFWIFVQYCLHTQLKDVCSYARDKGIVLKGDLPIGISRTSVDAWMYPKLFNMDSQAGAPPDAFSATGQNWGFPTYNWEEMSKDGYSWWKSRMTKMSEYFDAFRIDHILGFFRIWEIPVGASSGLLGHFNPALPYSAAELQSLGFDIHLFLEDPVRKGYFHPRIASQQTDVYNAMPQYLKDRYNNLYDDFFYRRHNQFWKESAMKKLPALLSATRMLACGEDLGMIPATVPEVMSDLKILSLEIQRMPKSVYETFGHPENYPYFCVCTTSTHDMNPIRAWWREDKSITQKFWNEILCEEGYAPEECSPEICEKIIKSHLDSPAMFTILPLQDYLSVDGNIRLADPEGERINVPANPKHYWRYRMHLTLENLLGQNEFNDKLRHLISGSGRV